MSKKLPLSLLVAGATALSDKLTSLSCLALVAAGSIAFQPQASAAIDPNGYVQITYNTGDLTAAQKLQVEKAANFLNSLIVGNAAGVGGHLPITVSTTNETEGSWAGVAGRGGFTGTATANGKTYSTSGALTLNLAAGVSVAVSAHEMLHAVGIGSLWSSNNLRGTNDQTNTADYRYIGANALAAWKMEFGQSTATFVPIMTPNDDGGGIGAGGHWSNGFKYASAFSKYTFYNDLMVYGDQEYLSYVSVGSLVDMGYKIKAPEANESGVYLLNTEFLTVAPADAYDYNFGRMGWLDEKTKEWKSNGMMVWGQLTGKNSLVVDAGTNTSDDGDKAVIVALMVANDYTGGTTINSGRLLIGNSAALGTGSVLVAGGILDLSVSDATVSALAMTGGVIVGTRADGESGHLTVSKTMDMHAGEVRTTLSGTAALNKTTAGTVTLASANNFTGATTISEGTLRISNGDALAQSSTISVNGGILNVTGVAMTTTGNVVLDSGSIVGDGGSVSAKSVTLRSGLVSAGIAGSGTVTKNTSGIVTLSAANTFTGGLEVADGTLIANAVGSLGAGGAKISGGTLQLAHEFAAASAELFVSGGTLSFGDLTAVTVGSITGSSNLALVNDKSQGIAFSIGADNTSKTYSGILSGSGSLQKVGTGDLTLTQENTHEGGTTVTAGTLILGTAKALGAGSLLVNGGTLVTGVADAQFSGTATVSAGVLRVSDTATFANGLTVAGGTLETTNKTITAPQLSLRGNGVLSPGGTAPVTLPLTGNLALSEGGTILVDLTSISGSTLTGDKVNVSGNTTFSGGYIQVATTDATKPQFGIAAYTFITSQEGISGQPTTVKGTYTDRQISGAEAGVSYAVPIAYKYNAGEDGKTGTLYVGYDYLSEKFAGGLNSNEFAVGGALNDLERVTPKDESNVPQDELLKVLNNIESFSALAKAYDSLMPVNTMTVSRSLTKQANSLTNNFDRRSRTMRRGSIQPGSIWTNYLFANSYGFDYNAHPLLASNDKGYLPYIGQSEEYPITIWLNGGGSFWKGKDDGFAPTTKSTQYAGNMGLDYTWQTDYGIRSATYNIGFLAGYSNITDKIGDAGSRNEISAISMGVYGSGYYNGFFGNVLASYAINSYDFKRDISIAGMNTVTARGKPDGAQYLGYINGGYEWEYRNWMHGPIVSLQYSQSAVDGYTETGAGDQSLALDKQKFDSLLASIGYRVSTRVKTEWATLLPEIRVSYNHEFLNDGQEITSMMSIPGARPFTVYTADPGRDYVNVGLGITVLLSESVSLSLDYDASLFQKNMDPQHTVNGMLRVSF